MARATDSSGRLQELAKCRIITPWGTIRMKILPEITDSKGANYQNEPIPGRTTPVPTYAYSEPRTINTDLTFAVTHCDDIFDNLQYYRWIQALTYPGGPGGGAPFVPPPVCKIVCGKMLGDNGVCVVLKNYSCKIPTDVAWDIETYVPYKFTVSCQWEVVYACKDLPTHNKIRVLTKDWSCPPVLTDIGTEVI